MENKFSRLRMNRGMLSGPNVDFREYMQQEMGRGQGLPDAVVKYGFRDQYVLLDTFYKSAGSNPAKGIFKFVLNIQQPTTNNDTIGVRERMDNIIEMQIAPFAMPIYMPVYDDVHIGSSHARSQCENLSNVTGTYVYMNNLQTTTTVAQKSLTNYPQIFPGQAFNIYVEEASTQAMARFGGLQHFELFTTYDYAITEYGGTYNAVAYDETNAAQCAVIPDTFDPHFLHLPLVQELETTTIVPAGTPPFPSYVTRTARTALNWDTYIFSDPLADLSTLTLRFSNINNALSFYEDVYYNVPYTFIQRKDQTVNYYDRETAGIVNLQIPHLSGNVTHPWVLCFYIPNHHLTRGERIIVSGFNSTDVDLKNFVNNPNGITIGNYFPPFSATPPANFTTDTYDNVIMTSPLILTANDPVNSGTCTVRVVSRRMRIWMRFRSVTDRVTNYKSL